MQAIQFKEKKCDYKFRLQRTVHSLFSNKIITNNDSNYRLPLPVLWDERLKKLFFPGTVRNFPLQLLSFGFNVELNNEFDDGIELDRLE